MDKKIIIIVAILAAVLLGAAGAGAYFLLPEPTELEAALAETPPEFVEIKVIASPVQRGGRVRGYVYIGVTLEVPDADNVESVQHRLPRLRDAYVLDLHRDPPRLAGKKGAIEIADVKTRFLDLAHEVFGKGIVRDVLVRQTIKVGD